MDDYVRDLPMREGVLLFLGINAVAQGNLDEAHRIEESLAGNVAIEVELLGGLFRGMAAIARGDHDGARAIATQIRQRAQASGYLIYAFEAVIIGGLGSRWGTLAGGVIIGVAQTFGAAINPEWQILAGHIAFIAVLLVRPRGLFPRAVD